MNAYRGYMGDRRIWYQLNNMEQDFIHTGSTQYWNFFEILDKHNNYDFWLKNLLALCGLARLSLGAVINKINRYESVLNRETTYIM